MFSFQSNFLRASSLACLFLLPLRGQDAIDPVRAANTIVLDETGVKNLGIETVEAAESGFEETVFALGRIEEVPSRHAVLSSRISGRIANIEAYPGDIVETGKTLVRVESRQPGDPPPVIDLKSPIDGVIVESHVHVGEPVEPEKELLDISDLSEVWAVARVPEHEAGKLKPGSKARIRVAAFGNEVVEGGLLRFGTSADRESGTIDAIFTVPNKDLRLRPGMRTEFEIVLSQRENVLSVPRESLQGDPASRHVFIRDFDLKNAFVRTPVRTGKTSGDKIEILGGLFPGDEVVTRGSYSLGFAGGGGGISLKEALDAAHGHEHNEDGSEKTPEQKAAGTPSGEGHGHDEAKAAPAWRERFFMAATAILAVLLAVSSLTKRQAARETTDPT